MRTREGRRGKGRRGGREEREGGRDGKGKGSAWARIRRGGSGGPEVKSFFLLVFFLLGPVPGLLLTLFFTTGEWVNSRDRGGIIRAEGDKKKHAWEQSLDDHSVDLRCSCAPSPWAAWALWTCPSVAR